MTTAQQAWEEWDALVGDVGCGAEPVAKIVRSLLAGETLAGPWSSGRWWIRTGGAGSKGVGGAGGVGWPDGGMD